MNVVHNDTLSLSLFHKHTCSHTCKSLEAVPLLAQVDPVRDRKATVIIVLCELIITMIILLNVCSSHSQISTSLVKTEVLNLRGRREREMVKRNKKEGGGEREREREIHIPDILVQVRWF